MTGGQKPSNAAERREAIAAKDAERRAGTRDPALRRAATQRASWLAAAAASGLAIATILYLVVAANHASLGLPDHRTGPRQSLIHTYWDGVVVAAAFAVVPTLVVCAIVWVIVLATGGVAGREYPPRRATVIAGTVGGALSVVVIALSSAA